MFKKTSSDGSNVSMNYTHPKDFGFDDFTKEIFNDGDKIILRTEYPDGVILIYKMDTNGVKVSSNYGFKIDGIESFTTDYSSKNVNFKDVI